MVIGIGWIVIAVIILLGGLSLAWKLGVISMLGELMFFFEENIMALLSSLDVDI